MGLQLTLSLSPCTGTLHTLIQIHTQLSVVYMSLSCISHLSPTVQCESTLSQVDYLSHCKLTFFRHNSSCCRYEGASGRPFCSSLFRLCPIPLSSFLFPPPPPLIFLPLSSSSSSISIPHFPLTLLPLYPPPSYLSQVNDTLPLHSAFFLKYFCARNTLSSLFRHTSAPVPLLPSFPPFFSQHTNDGPPSIQGSVARPGSLHTLAIIPRHRCSARPPS